MFIGWIPIEFAKFIDCKSKLENNLTQKFLGWHSVKCGSSLQPVKKHAPRFPLYICFQCIENLTSHWTDFELTLILKLGHWYSGEQFRTSMALLLYLCAQEAGKGIVMFSFIIVCVLFGRRNIIKWTLQLYVDPSDGIVSHCWVRLTHFCYTPCVWLYFIRIVSCNYKPDISGLGMLHREK